MVTALDTNVLVALWDEDDALNSSALAALDAAYDRGGIVISGAVHAELMAFPGRTEKFLNKFLTDTGITVDWATNEKIWRLAGSAFSSYAARRRKQLVDNGSPPARGGVAEGRGGGSLADFLIGAHAVENGYSLLTLDTSIFRAGFPKLKIYGI